MSLRDPAAALGSRPWRAGFAGVLLWVMAAGTMLQFTLGVLAPFLTAEFGISRAQLGFLTTAFFGVAAALSPVAGRIVDRVGGRRATLATLAGSAVALAAFAGAPTYGWLIAAVALAGFGAALTNPVTNRLIAVHLPRGRQGVITGVKQSGVQVGAALAGAALPALALTLGWRATVVIVAVTAAIGLVAAVVVVPARDPTDDERAARDGAAPPAAARRGFVSWLSTYAFLMGVTTAVVPAFVVLFGVESLQLGETTAGAAAATVGAVGVVARMLWGRAAEQMATPTAPLLVLAVGSTGAQALIWGAELAPWLLWVGVVAFGATAAAWNSVAMLAIVREMPPAATGGASGVVQSAFYLGLMVGPLTFGWTVDVTDAYHVGWAAVVGLLVITSAMTAVWHARFRRPAVDRPW